MIKTFNDSFKTKTLCLDSFLTQDHLYIIKINWYFICQASLPTKIENLTTIANAPMSRVKAFFTSVMPLKPWKILVGYKNNNKN